MQSPFKIQRKHILLSLSALLTVIAFQNCADSFEASSVDESSQDSTANTKSGLDGFGMPIAEGSFSAEALPPSGSGDSNLPVNLCEQYRNYFDNLESAPEGSVVDWAGGYLVKVTPTDADFYPAAPPNDKMLASFDQLSFYGPRVIKNDRPFSRFPYLIRRSDRLGLGYFTIDASRSIYLPDARSRYDSALTNLFPQIAERWEFEFKLSNRPLYLSEAGNCFADYKNSISFPSPLCDAWHATFEQHKPGDVIEWPRERDRIVISQYPFWHARAGEKIIIYQPREAPPPVRLRRSDSPDQVVRGVQDYYRSYFTISIWPYNYVVPGTQPPPPIKISGMGQMIDTWLKDQIDDNPIDNVWKIYEGYSSPLKSNRAPYICPP